MLPQVSTWSLDHFILKTIIFQCLMQRPRSLLELHKGISDGLDPMNNAWPYVQRKIPEAKKSKGNIAQPASQKRL
jgi:hypothetical protein